MNEIELKIQKQIVEIFKELELELESVSKRTISFGYKHRNELIAHINSDNNNHEKLNESKTKWDNNVIKQNLLVFIHTLFTNERDLYGYFENYNNIIEELQNLINTAIIKEEYLIAEELQNWLNRLNSCLIN
jgi:hypothetical protein